MEVLLFSGGLDSFIAYNYLQVEGKNPVPLYVDYEGKYTSKEKDIATYVLQETKIISGMFNFFGIEKGDKAFIPNRNMYLIGAASSFSDDVTTIYLAGLKDDNVGDKCDAFYTLMGKTLSQSLGREIEVISPF